MNSTTATATPFLPTTPPAPEVLRQIRELGGASHAELGRLVSVSGRTVARWEQGIVPRNALTRERLNQVLGLVLLKGLGS